MTVLLFRLADVPRVVRRLASPLAVSLEGAGPDADGATRAVRAEWTMRPTLLNARSARTRARVAEVMELYAMTEGQPRSAVEDMAPRIEDILDDYRLARCVARTIEVLGYRFDPPPRALPRAPADLRALLYRRAQERYRGYVPRDRRAAFLAELAAEVGATPEALEEALWADRAGAAILRAGPAPAPEGAPVPDGERPPDGEPLRPDEVIARYNAGAVATILAASSLVTLSLPATETAALKSLYRHAKARHVGVEIALAGGADADGGEDAGLLAVTLYGPGSRALVRGRTVRSADGPAVGSGSGADGVAGDVAVPAPGGAPVAAVVAGLARRHPGAIREGRALLLGPERRLFHVPLDELTLAALGDAPTADPEGEGDDGALISYDSDVEAAFARAFLAAAAEGRLGVARGWAMEREPRAIVVDGGVFLPDFLFRRGDMEVLCEVVGFYTEDYLARKRRKLAHLGGLIPLLLVVDAERAPLFSALGLPMITYKAGRGISVTEVAQTLDSAFDPFARRRARAGRVLAALCAADGPRLTEEEACAAIGCAGRTELTTLWADVDASEAAAGTAVGVGGGDARGLRRRYVPGYGLVSAAALDRARAALAGLLGDAGGPVSLEEALACCADAGLPDPDDAVMADLGGVVVRSGLFGEASVYRQGADAESALAAALSAGPSSRRRRRA